MLISYDHTLYSINYGTLFLCRKVNDRLKKQLDLLWHTTNIYMHPGIHEYAEKLTAKLPGDLKVKTYMYHMYRKSGNFRCKNIFVVDGGYEN